MGATSEGDIVQLDQARGINKALMKMVDAIVNDAQHVENKRLPSLIATARSAPRW